jgi:PAB-dependent poly(A)-specific ribonuclease subunit 2
VAFDAEFVSVQEEETRMNESGSKVVIRDTRYAVARISVIDCDTRKVILDDHVLPKERVVDYLTRFSGIVAEDLDPVKSPHNLISSRSAYLKLRYLMEQGCIFVGHGLRQDFMTLNLIVPPHQILGKFQRW